jgi:predicted cobalt transporter CbtA
MSRPGSAMLELLKAEANPVSQVEHAILALQILQREGLQDSSQKMISYLKRRWGLSDEEMHRFLSDHKIPFYMGPMPTADAGQRAKGSFWYIATALLSVPVAMLVGMDFLWAVICGIILLAFCLILTAQKKN